MDGCVVQREKSGQEMLAQSPGTGRHRGLRRVEASMLELARHDCTVAQGLVAYTPGLSEWMSCGPVWEALLFCIAEESRGYKSADFHPQSEAAFSLLGRVFVANAVGGAVRGLRRHEVHNVATVLCSLNSAQIEHGFYELCRGAKRRAIQQCYQREACLVMDVPTLCGQLHALQCFYKEAASRQESVLCWTYTL